MKILRAVFLIIGMLYSNGRATAGNALFSNTILYQNQGLMSTAGQYSLWMQGDGNLVMYRKDGTVRWSAGKKGWFSIMQGDGNFVLYNPSYVPMFYTGTSGHPGSFLAVQDDGNLVIYGPNGQGALWWIGTDVNNDDPRSPGDTVGRDLILGPLGPIGHIGIWDGSKVVQAMMGLSNAIESVSLSQFKAASRYWGAAKPNVPFAFVDPECYYVHCGGDADISVLSTRTAIAQRARQIQAIGADYTLIPDATITAYPSFGNRPSIRGKYRCDTFVLDAYRYSTTFSIHMTPEQIKWVNRVQSLSSGIFFPYTVYNKLRSFN